MAKLDAAERKDIKSKNFGLPGERKFPVEDKSHARNAKARASEMYNQGRITAAQKAEIDAKADRKLNG